MMPIFVTISSITTEFNLTPLKERIRKINNETTAQFLRLLENEMWEPVFENRDTNYEFSTFLYTFLRIFEPSFPVQNKSVGKIKKITGLHTELKYLASVKGAYIYIYIAGAVIIHT
jgi:hypothetical protein